MLSNELLEGQLNIFDLPVIKTDMEIIKQLGDSYWKFFKKYMVTFNIILDLQTNIFSKERYLEFIYSQWGDEYTEDLTQEQLELFYELSLNRIERILKIDVSKYR